MPLIKSVSGIRGTIGGRQGENLTPADIIAFVSAYASWLLRHHENPTVVIGRDGRISGAHVSTMVSETLRAMGIHVVDAGYSTTPSVEVYVTHIQAHGGIIITASHNPREWNALKFLNDKGEFISQRDGEELLEIARSGAIVFADVDRFGNYQLISDSISYHISEICKLDLVDPDLVRSKNFHLTVDCVNSTGALAIPALLDALGCSYSLLNGNINGQFAHNPEPLAEHLVDLCQSVIGNRSVMGIAVDPDVDRLALVDENGVYFGEEYTLVLVSDYVLSHSPGPVVSNLSSSKALADLAASRDQVYASSRVGEVHVVREMKQTGAVIGGEGNGGVIYPALHYGRDALVGIALVLTYLAKTGKTLSQLKAGYQHYVIAKEKIALEKTVNVPSLLEKITSEYPNAQIDTRDGLKLLLSNGWIHLRASNTEPVIRIYAESTSAEEADDLAQAAKRKLVALSKG